MKILPVGFILVTLNLVFSPEGANSQLSRLTYARVDSLADCVRYLFKFGYIKDLNEVAALLTPNFSPSLISPTNPAATALRLGLSKFQQYAKLPVTGQFDQPTKAKMNTPRCGNKDILNISPALNALLRKRRYVTSGFKWHKTELTYKISKFSESGFSPEITLKEVDQAFEVWGNATNLYFIRSDNAKTVDIELKFARLSHGDVEPFDGRGITLAHAFPPGESIGGDIHFDDDEEFTSGEYKGTNFFRVVVHELGHALGLRHSDVEDAIMYAYARSYEPTFQLHEDDLQGIRALYGTRSAGGGGNNKPKPDNGTSSSTTGSTTTPILIPSQSSESAEENPSTSTTAKPTSTTAKPNPTPEKDTKPDLCKDSKIDAITALADERVYAFKGAYAFKIDANGDGIVHSATEKISYVFYGLPSNIDAAVTYEGKTYFFKDEHYWRYENRKIDGEFPKLISKDFPGIPDNIDAAFTWSGDDQMYFFKGDQYWSFNPREKPPVAKLYPLPISQWYGLPTKDIDAAFKSPNGPTYFFKDQSYWLFDDENFQVAEAEPPYPRSTRVMWLGCTPYRPGPNELKKGWIRKLVDKLRGTVEGVTSHFDRKIKKLTTWLF